MYQNMQVSRIIMFTITFLRIIWRRLLGKYIVTTILSDNLSHMAEVEPNQYAKLVNCKGLTHTQTNLPVLHYVQPTHAERVKTVDWDFTL